MDLSRHLSLPEFLTDLRGVIVSPKTRFPVIQERGALWGSLLLLLLPGYIGSAWTGGIYFDHDPLPGYSLILPLLVALLVTVLKLYPIHFLGRVIQRGPAREARGSFRQMAAVFGYASVPSVLALLLLTLLFFLAPDFFGSLFRDYRVAAFSGAITLGVAVFAWHFILVVLALRTVYPLRDWQLVVAFVGGTVIGGLVAWSLFAPVLQEVRIQGAYVEPFFCDRVLRFEGVEASASKDNRIQVPIDRLRYRLKTPARFDPVVFAPSPAYGIEPRKAGRPELAGRIVGLPGEEVEVDGNRLTVGSETWVESYLPPEYATEGRIRARKLSADEYLILPENRRLVNDHPNEWYVPRRRIAGRILVTKWPIGWLLHRPTVFESPQRIPPR